MKLLCSIGLVALIALFFIPVNFTVDVEFWRTLTDVMHLPLFAVIAGLLYPFFKKRGEDMRLRNCRNAFAAAATVAIVIELVQPLMGRSQSMLDQMYGIVGAAFGAAFIYLWPKRLEEYNVLVLLAGAIAVGAAIAGPPMRKYRTIEHRLEEFPMLGSFEDGRPEPVAAKLVFIHRRGALPVIDELRDPGRVLTGGCGGGWRLARGELRCRGTGLEHV